MHQGSPANSVVHPPSLCPMHHMMCFLCMSFGGYTEHPPDVDLRCLQHWWKLRCVQYVILYSVSSIFDCSVHMAMATVLHPRYEMYGKHMCSKMFQ